MPTYVALLRAINVGGRNRLKMADLRSVFETLGCANVATYIQSGNVVFDAPKRAARSLAPKVEGALADRHGLTVPVILRAAEELAAVPERCPFADRDPKSLHVMFLRDEPSGQRPLGPHEFAPAELALRGREIFLHMPQGMARTKLTNVLVDERLRTVSTTRNWRTLHKVIAMTSP